MFCTVIWSVCNRDCVDMDCSCSTCVCFVTGLCFEEGYMQSGGAELPSVTGFDQTSLKSHMLKLSNGSSRCLYTCVPYSCLLYTCPCCTHNVQYDAHAGFLLNSCKGNRTARFCTAITLCCKTSVSLYTLACVPRTPCLYKV